MLRYKTKTRPGLVALYDIRPGNGAGPFLQPRSPHGAGGEGRRHICHIHHIRFIAFRFKNINSFFSKHEVHGFCTFYRLQFTIKCSHYSVFNQCSTILSTVESARLLLDSLYIVTGLVPHISRIGIRGRPCKKFPHIYFDHHAKVGCRFS